MTAIDRSILTVVAAALILGAGYLVRAAWQRFTIARLRNGGSPTSGRAATPSLMYFRAEGCAPCRIQEMQIRELQGSLEASGQQLLITSHDAVAETSLVHELRIVTVPTTVLRAGDGRVVAWNPGLTDARTLLRQVRPYLGRTTDGSPSRGTAVETYRRADHAAHQH